MTTGAWKPGLPACLLALSLAVGAQGREYDDGDVPQPYAAPGVLIVKYGIPLAVDGAAAASGGSAGAHIGVPSIDRIHDAYGVSRVDRLIPRAANPRYAGRASGLERYVRIRFPAGTDAEALRKDLLADPLVLEADYAMAFPLDAIPNDPSFGSQWAFVDGQDNDIDAPEAWDMMPGDTLILLGATDTGVQHDHPDLAGPTPFTGGNIWINWTEYYGAPEVDDDGNGYVDDVRGWDWVDVESFWPGEDGIEPDNNPMDFNGHGTHVSGIMAAMTNNGVGGAGTAGGWYGGRRGCRIVPLRIGWSEDVSGSERGFVRMDFAAQAFNYGVMMGVSAFNCSWGSSGGSGFATAVANALAHGVSIVTSAGNSNTITSGYLENTPGVINVASTTSSDIKSGFSDYGDEVEVSAPGSSIYNTYSAHGQPGYAWLSGTSMASPHVAALVGLVRAVNPELEGYRADSIVIATADNIDVQNPAYIGQLGSGRINARAALAAVPIADFAADRLFGQAPLLVQFHDHSYMNPVSWDWAFGNGETSTDLNPATTYTEPGYYTVSLTTQSDAGSKTTTRTDLILVVVDTVGGGSGEATVNHTGSAELLVALSVPVDSLVIPFAATGAASLTFDSVSLGEPGARLFTSVSLDGFDPVSGAGVLRFRSDTGAVNPGASGLARFHFHAGLGMPGDELLLGDTDRFGADSLLAYAPRGAYRPVYVPTAARIGSFPQGDVSLDGFLTSRDVISLVNYVFKSSALAFPELGDVDASERVDASDIIYMVNYLFKSGPPPIG